MVIRFLIICALSLPLVGCGVKPKKLSAPDGAEASEFPRTYPTSK